MLKNYLKTAFRNLLKNKSYVIINTFGLGIALACCVTAYILLAYNIEFDSYYDDDKMANTFVVHSHLLMNNGEERRDVNAPLNLAPQAIKDIAGINKYMRIWYDGGYVRYGDYAFREGIAFADSTFFDMVDIPMTKGSSESFNERHTIILNDDLATKYFGDEDPIGKVLICNFPNEKEIHVTVGGVFESLPLNNSFYVRALMRYEHFLDIYDLGSAEWGDWRDPSVFFELSNPGNAGNIGNLLNQYTQRRNEAKEDATVQRYSLVPFKNNFNEEDLGWGQVNLRISPVPLIVFCTLGIMILLIACFNLTNTTIAMTAKRLKEIGVRKSIGATRYQIVTQFMMEMVLTILLALFIGLALSRILVPAFTDMWDLPYGLEDLDGVNLVIMLLLLVFSAALLAGLYPSLFSSKFNPVVLLKGTVKVKGTNALTNMLVTLQFAISVIVLIAGVSFTQNSQYQEKIDFGYDKEMVVNVRIQNKSEYELMRNKVLSNPDIEVVAVSAHQVGNNNYSFPVKIDTTEYTTRMIGMGENFMEVMGFNVVEGRFMDLANSATDKESSIVVNKQFVKMAGLENPLQTQVEVHSIKRRIVGVIDDHIDNLYRDTEGAEPFLFYAGLENEYNTMLVRANAGDLADVNSYLEGAWKEVIPTKPYESQFQEDVVLENSLQLNSNLQKIFLFLTVLGGLLSASGIFSLATLNIEKRNKEIGIRKALGASVDNIVVLLNREFFFIMIAAGVLGSVGGYFLTNALLNDIYNYFLEVGIITVILCALTVFLIGILTTSGTIFQAAKANPVSTLRDE